MKIFFSLVIALFFTASTWAQSPDKISYQSVIRNANDSLVMNKKISMKITILQGDMFENKVYVETQTPLSNTNGLVTLEIGTGNIESGDFTNIEWNKGPFFIKTETDPTGNTNYTITGTSQLMSVPYALHSNTADSIVGGISFIEVDGSITNEIELPISPSKGAMNYWNGIAWVEVIPSVNEGSYLQMIGGVPTWTGGEAQISPAVGDFRDGGVVFWVDGNGGGLVCAISDQSNLIHWYNGLDAITGSSGVAIGTGQANTVAIITTQGAIETSYAAGLAKAYTAGEYSDWFLPSKDELNEMYLNKNKIDSTAIANGGASFTNQWYWSSSEYDNTSSWTEIFSSGIQTRHYKHNWHSVRAVRAF